MELKISQHIRRICLCSVILKMEDTALMGTLTPANNKKSLSMQIVTMRN